MNLNVSTKDRMSTIEFLSALKERATIDEGMLKPIVFSLNGKLFAVARPISTSKQKYDNCFLVEIEY